jgi:RNA polymerase sigma-70 factor (ECF subfamily)
MSTLPETRASLLLKIADAGDHQAWDEFVRLYRPAVYQMGCRQGLQHADAEELAQETLMAVARAVDRWEPSTQRGAFRSWLSRIARNLAINLLTRRKHQVWGTGRSSMQLQLDKLRDPHEELSRIFEMEYRRAIFRCAAKQVQSAVTESTWKAFWMTTIEDHPVAAVAAQLGLSAGAVYIARNRVVARLRAEVRRIEDADNLSRVCERTL